jgi:hypothetical protein
MHDIFIASLNFWPLLPPGVKAQTALSTRFKLNFPNIFFATRIYANIETLYAICFRDKMLRQNSTWRVITHCPDEEVEITWFISCVLSCCFESSLIPVQLLPPDGMFSNEEARVLSRLSWQRSWG